MVELRRCLFSLVCAPMSAVIHGKTNFVQAGGGCGTVWRIGGCRLQRHSGSSRVFGCVQKSCRRLPACRPYFVPAHRRYARTAPSRRGGLTGRCTPFSRRAHTLPLRLSASAPFKRGTGAIGARLVCKREHQYLQEEPGLDHFEHRSSKEPHRHALTTMIAPVLLWAQRRRNRPKDEQRVDNPTSWPRLSGNQAGHR